MGELYHHGVKGMKWGVRKKPQYETVFTIPARKKKTSSKTSTKKSKNDNLTDEQLAAKKAKRKKALVFAGMTAASVAITGIGMYAMHSPKVRGAIYKGMAATEKTSFDPFKNDPNAGRMYSKKTGKYFDIEDFYTWTVNPDGSTKFTKKPGVITPDDLEWR